MEALFIELSKRKNETKYFICQKLNHTDEGNVINSTTRNDAHMACAFDQKFTESSFAENITNTGLLTKPLLLYGFLSPRVLKRAIYVSPFFVAERMQFYGFHGRQHGLMF